MISQDDFFAIIDWVASIDVWCCITMYGITDRYLSGHKAENAAFVHVLLGELESRIHSFFSVVRLNLLFFLVYGVGCYLVIVRSCSD